MSDPVVAERTPPRDVCASCGEALATADRFCSACGAPILGVESRWAAPRIDLPAHLADRIHAGRGRLEGERKQITVLFADLKDSMQLMATRDPEEARVVLDAVLVRMMEAVHRYDGTVNQVMGDGVMALFGAPLALEDHAVRACYAALRMQEDIRRYAEGVRSTVPVPVQIRIGLNSGEVVVRSIGSDLRMDYTAVGATTHLAARMEQAARPEAIFVTTATKRLVERYVSLRPVEAVAVKGLAEPSEAWEVTGLGPARTRMQAAVRRGLSRLVGREAELAALRGAFERARSGHRQVVSLVGEPGVGKSRLAWEVIESERDRGLLILESSSVSYGRATTHLPIADMLRAYFRIEVSDAPATLREKVAAHLAALGETPASDPSAVLAFMDIAPEDPAWESLDPPQRRLRTLDALRRLLMRESQRQPVLVVFEDFQRIDPETRELLDALVKSLDGARLLLMVEYRPDYSHDWADRDYHTQLRVDPLSGESADALFESLAGRDASIGRLKRLLIERAGGNPFFLEESVLALAETGALEGAPGAYRMAGEFDVVRIPATVQAVVAARIDRLAPADKTLLQTAAVVGKDVPLDVLATVAGLDELALRQGLARLTRAEFLYETHLFPELEYTFKHAFTHEVAYGSLLAERRLALHARIAQSMESLYSDRTGEYVERLAHHSFRGELWTRAIAYLRQAGLKAYERSAFRRAVRWIEQALEALEHLPPDPGRQALAVDLRFDLRNALLALGELEQIIGHLRDAERLALAIGDRARLGRASAYLAAHFWLTGKHKFALQSGQRALEIAEVLGDPALRVPATFYLGAASHLLGDYPRALELLRHNVEALQGDLQRERFGMAGLPSVFSRTIRGWVCAEQGRFEQGLAEVRDARTIAEQNAHPFSLLSAYLVESVLHLRRGDAARATPVLQRGLALARAERVALWSPTFALLLGLAYAQTGRAEEGLALATQGLPAAVRTGGLVPFALIAAGEVSLAAARVEEARAIARRALGEAVEREERGYEGWAWRLAGEVEASVEPGDLGRAEDCFRHALVRAEALGMRPLAACCQFSLGSVSRRAGRTANADEHLNAAVVLFRSMDMGVWQARTEALMLRH